MTRAEQLLESLEDLRKETEERQKKTFGIETSTNLTDILFYNTFLQEVVDRLSLSKRQLLMHMPEIIGKYIHYARSNPGHSARQQAVDNAVEHVEHYF